MNIQQTTIYTNPKQKIYIQPIASFIFILQSQSRWSLFNGTWQKRPGKLDYSLRFEMEGITLQMQLAVLMYKSYKQTFIHI